jgi:imidazolonepropionase-like amidohydrolase
MLQIQEESMKSRSLARTVGGVLAAIAVILVSRTGLAQSQESSDDSGTLVIYGGTLIDGTGARPVADGVLVITNGRIEAVGRASDVVIQENAARLDAHGGTIMPGVIDPHTHIGDTLWRQVDILSPWLQTGVTTVQDLGTLWPLIPLYRERAALLPGPPRLQFGGPIISPTGGYPADEWSVKYGVDTVEEAREFVKKLIEETQVDVIKIAIERGYSIDYDEPGLPVLTPEQVAAICDEAHAHGKIVIAHATIPEVRLR